MAPCFFFHSTHMEIWREHQYESAEAYVLHMQHIHQMGEEEREAYLAVVDACVVAAWNAYIAEKKSPEKELMETEDLKL